MEVKIYEYVGSCGGGLAYTLIGEDDDYENSKEWEYLGTYDLPLRFVEKCLPSFYIE